MPTPEDDEAQKRRNALRSAGLRPTRIRAPHTRLQDFAEECRRQSRTVAAADAASRELDSFLDAAIADLDDVAVIGRD